MKNFVNIFLMCALVLLATACDDDKPVVVPVTGIELLDPTPEAVPLEGGVFEIKKDDIHYIHARVTPRDGTDKIIWSSEDESVVFVNEWGYVTGIDQGTTTIWARVEGTSLAASIVIAVGGTVDAEQIAAPYRGGLTTTVTGAATAPNPDVVASLTRLTSRTAEFRTPSVRIPNGMMAFNATITCVLNVSMNTRGEYVLEGRGNLSQGNWAFVANGTIDGDGNLILDMDVTVDYLGSIIPLPIRYTAKDAGGMGGTFLGGVSVVGGLLGGASFPNIEATAVRTSPTTFDYKSATFNVPGVGNTSLDATFTVALTEDFQFVLTGTGGSTAARAPTVEGTGGRTGNVVLNWVFGVIGGLDYGTFRYTAEKQP